MTTKEFYQFTAKNISGEDKSIADMHGAKTKEEAILASYKEEDKLIRYMDKVWIP